MNTRNREIHLGLFTFVRTFTYVGNYCSLPEMLMNNHSGNLKKDYHYFIITVCKIIFIKTDFMAWILSTGPHRDDVRLSNWLELSILELLMP